MLLIKQIFLLEALKSRANYTSLGAIAITVTVAVASSPVLVENRRTDPENVPM